MVLAHRHTRKSMLGLVLSMVAAVCAAACGSPAVPTITTTAPAEASTTMAIAPAEGLKDINGTQLFYKAMGKGAPIVVLHGRSGSHRYFLPQLGPLADEYQLLFYDQRGTGASSGQIDLKAISIDQFVEDLEALRVAFGLEKMSLIGHSRGAIIALFYAFKYQAHLDKLILVDPVPISNSFLAEQDRTIRQRFGQLSSEEQHMLGTACQRSSAEAAAECLKIDAKLRFSDPAKALTMDATLEKNTARNAATVESLLTASLNRKQHDLEASLKAITVPTLIVHGDFDPIPIASSEYIQQHIPTSQLTIIKQSGHFPFVEQPETFLATIRAFMKR